MLRRCTFFGRKSPVSGYGPKFLTPLMVAQKMVPHVSNSAISVSQFAIDFSNIFPHEKKLPMGQESAVQNIPSLTKKSEMAQQFLTASPPTYPLGWPIGERIKRNDNLWKWKWLGVFFAAFTLPTFSTTSSWVFSCTKAHHFRPKPHRLYTPPSWSLIHSLGSKGSRSRISGLRCPGVFDCTHGAFQAFESNPGEMRNREQGPWLLLDSDRNIIWGLEKKKMTNYQDAPIRNIVRYQDAHEYLSEVNNRDFRLPAMKFTGKKKGRLYQLVSRSSKTICLGHLQGSDYTGYMYMYTYTYNWLD